MKQYDKPVYVCDHCRKLYKRKSAATYHEKWCTRNPDNWAACFTCQHLKVDREEYDGGFHDRLSVKTFTCTKLDKELHSFKAEKISHACLGHTERMPKTCPDFQDAMDSYFQDIPEGGSPVKFISSMQTPTP